MANPKGIPTPRPSGGFTSENMGFDRPGYPTDFNSTGFGDLEGSIDTTPPDPPPASAGDFNNQES